MTQEERNKEFGRKLAESMWEAGWNRCPFYLNSEQADALLERWNELRKEKK